jgi:hypothetical protein
LSLTANVVEMPPISSFLMWLKEWELMIFGPLDYASIYRIVNNYK